MKVKKELKTESSPRKSKSPKRGQEKSKANGENGKQNALGFMDALANQEANLISMASL